MWRDYQYYISFHLKLRCDVIAVIVYALLCVFVNVWKQSKWNIYKIKHSGTKCQYPKLQQNEPCHIINAKLNKLLKRREKSFADVLWNLCFKSYNRKVHGNLSMNLPRKRPVCLSTFSKTHYFMKCVNILSFLVQNEPQDKSKEELRTRKKMRQQTIFKKNSSFTTLGRL